MIRILEMSVRLGIEFSGQLLVISGQFVS
jgi:hypothetical protein